MKKVLLLTAALASCLSGFLPASKAQVINLVEPTFLVNSPSSVAGVKVIESANDGSGDANQWGRAIDSFWYNIPVAIIPSDTIGCNNIPAGSLTGKFALISRGTCQFSEKAYNAQQAGALAVIIYNNTSGGPVGMASGTNGTLVNIPVIMISQADGVALSTLINSNQPVFASLTNWGFGFNHDLGIVNNSMALWHNYAIPKYELASGSPTAYKFVTGGLVVNLGKNTETNIKLKSEVSFTPTGGSATTLLSDSVIVGSITTNDSLGELLSPSSQSLPSISQTGKVNVAYTLTSNTPDEQPGNNIMNYSFDVTDSIYSKVRLNDNMEPVATGGYRFSNSSTNTWGPLFYVREGGHRAVSAQFTVSNSDNATSLFGWSVSMYLYKWSDLNLDQLVQAEELALVGGGDKVFSTLDTNYHIFTVPLEDVFNPANDLILDANSWYWLAAEVSGDLFLGVDRGINYYMRSYTSSKLSSPMIDVWSPQFQGSSNDLMNTLGNLFNFPFNAAEVTEIDSVSFPGAKGLVPAISMHTSKAIVNSIAGSPGSVNSSVSIYPNPASDYLQVSLNFESMPLKTTVSILDASGRLLYKNIESPDNKGTIKLNTDFLTSGNYYVIIHADGKMLANKFTIVK